MKRLVINFKLLLLFLFIFSSNLISAQNSKVSGTVWDESKEGITGATVFLKTINQGTVTNAKGQYELDNLPLGEHTLLVTFIGYESQTIEIIVSGSHIKQDFTLVAKNELLEDILITAGRIQERVDEIPISSKVVTGQKLSKQLNSTSNVAQMLAYTVPAMAPSTETASNWGQTLRGRNVLSFVDGIPQGTPLRNGQLGIRSVDGNVLERVEVINGATSIYGGGAGGGIINYITKRPATDKKLSSTTRLNSHGSLVKTDESLGYDVSQLFTGTINKLDYVLNAGYEQTGTQYDNDGDVLLPTYGLANNHSVSLFGKIGYNFNTDTRLEAVISRYSSKQKSDYIAVRGQQKFEDGQYYIEKGYGVKGEIDGSVDPGTEVLNSNLTFTKNGLFNNSNLTVNSYFQEADNTFFHSPNFVGGGQSRILSKKYGVRSFLESNWQIMNENELTLVYGVDMLQDITSQPLVDGRLWVPEITMRALAPFVEGRFNIHKDWALKAGVRYDKMTIGVDDFATLPYSSKGDGNFSAPINVQGGDLDYESLTYNAGVRFIKNKAFTPFVSFSQGFALPDLGRILRSAMTDNINDIDLEAIITNNYEIGFSSRTNYLKVEAVGFYSSSEHGTALAFNEEQNRFVTSRAPHRIFGYELSADLKLGSKIKIGSAYAFVEGLAKNEDATFNYLPGNLIPPSKLTAYVDYKATDKWSMLINCLAVGDRDHFLAKEDGLYKYGQAPVDGYTVVNFLTNYQVNKTIGFNVAVNNLFNADYFPSRSQWSAPLGTFIVKGEGTNFRIGCTIKL